MLFHVFAHVEADDRVFGSEHFDCQLFGQFGLTDTGRPYEQEGTDRSVFTAQSDSVSADGFRYFVDGFILTDDVFLQTGIFVLISMIFWISCSVMTGSPSAGAGFCFILLRFVI